MKINFTAIASWVFVGSVLTTGQILAEDCTPPAGFIGIHNQQELQNMNNDVTAKYFLCNDINLSGYFNPIIGPLVAGNQIFFTGLFEGNNKTIRNLMIYGNSYLGLFGGIDSQGEVRNFKLRNINIYGNSQIGSVVGLNYGYVHHITIDGSNLDSAITQLTSTNAYSYVGAIAGQNATRFGAPATQTGRIEDVSVSGTVVLNGGGYMGGIVGVNISQAKIARASFSGFINSTGVIVGGIAGHSGLASDIVDVFAWINHDSAYPNSRVGGLVGELTGGSRVMNGLAYNTPNYVHAAARPSPVVGFASSDSAVNNCYWDSDYQSSTSPYGQARPAMILKAYPATAYSTYVGWDFLNVWQQVDGQLPTIRKIHPCKADFDGSGIVDFNDLLTLSQNYGKNVSPLSLGNVNSDNVVNYDDLLALSQNYGKTCAQITAARPSSAKVAAVTARSVSNP